MTAQQLDIKANEIRQDLIRMLVEAGSGHSAGPLDMADVFTALYFGDLLRFDKNNSDWQDRDRLVLSCGHICPIFYTTLIHAGILRNDELLTLRKLGTRLQGHPHHEQVYSQYQTRHENTPGVENSSGPLGQGISVAVGMAMALRMDNSQSRVYLIGSDGETQEGQTWEALMFAGNHHLDNLTYIVDRNNIQIDGYTEKVAPLEPFHNKLEAFNFHVLEINGHNMEEILTAVKQSWKIKGKPIAIVCNNIPGYGVQFMTGDYAWHGKPPNKEQGEEALKELRTLGDKLKFEG